jgi:hypothetical protein
MDRACAIRVGVILHFGPPLRPRARTKASPSTVRSTTQRSRRACGRTAARPEWKVARSKGRLRGKQPKLSVRQEAHLVSLYRGGEHTVGELEELFGVTRSTVYRAVRRAAETAA